VLWFGAGLGAYGGATRYDGQTWYTLTAADGLGEFRVRSLFIDRQGGRWFGSESAGITLIKDGTSRVFSPDNGLSGWEVLTMLQDQQGDLWLGTENGLTRIRAGFW
jgi:ligand-binding sensor domain-containing protein